jgi:hypothetical protein
VAQGGPLEFPRGLDFAPDGSLAVGQMTAPILRVDPLSGAIETLVPQPPGGELFNSFDVRFDPAGNLFIANDRAGGRSSVLRVDAATAALEIVTVGGFLVRPFGIALAADGRILVSDTAQRVIAVDAETGAQSLLTYAGLLLTPRAIAVVGELAEPPACEPRVKPLRCFDRDRPRPKPVHPGRHFGWPRWGRRAPAR